MKFTKAQINEIIDSNGELIGKNDVPSTGSDLESAANNTTDYNQKIGQQPFRYDMLGRFGFTMMPFMEGKESQEQLELVKDLKELMHQRFMDIAGYYYKNPEKLKSDYRRQDGGEHTKECEKLDAEYANKIMAVIRKHFEKAFEPNNIDESAVVEDKVVDKKTEDEMSSKAEDKEVQEKKLEKIAGLISKLDQEAKDKLKNLLERNG
jgi:hypothetical protein